MRTFSKTLIHHRFTISVGKSLAVLGFLACATTAAHAAVDEETLFVFNTFSFLIWGALVMWMCAGFTMLESGSVRTKNASMICLKNIGLYSIAGLAYYFIGYNLMYVDVESVIGSFKFLYGPSGDEIALIAGNEASKAAGVENGYSTMSNWFFQMVFVATTASIVSGALAERVKMWSFFLFPFYSGADSDYLSHRRRVDMGRGMAQCDGFQGFCWIDHRA